MFFILPIRSPPLPPSPPPYPPYLPKPHDLPKPHNLPQPHSLSIPATPSGDCGLLPSDKPRGDAKLSVGETGSPRMFQKILVLSASAGVGHVRAGQALETAFRQTHAAVEVRHVDTLAFTNALFRKLYADAYIKMVNKAPKVLGWLYDRLDQPGESRTVSGALNKLNTYRFRKMLKKYQPDIAVCTHFLPAEIIGRLLLKDVLNCPLATVVTDMDAHAFWLSPGIDHYFVAIEETARHLIELGTPGDQVTATGIPIDPIFAESKDKRAMRRHYGLSEETTTILVSAGGFGVGPLENMIASLMKLKHPVQIIVICGRNEELQAKLQAGQGQMPHRLLPVGFTREMDQYMAASDILVGKPGGLTMSEALAKGLVFCIVNPIPGQEERNSDHLLEEGAAIRCNNLPALAWKLDNLLADPVRFRWMQQNVQRLAKPNAAMEIVGHLNRLFGQQA